MKFSSKLSPKNVRRIPDGWVSGALGLTLPFYFIDGYIRGADPGTAAVLVVLGVFIVIGLVEVTDKSHAHGIRLGVPPVRLTSICSDMRCWKDVCSASRLSARIPS